MIANALTWLNGKKVVIGSLITVTSSIVATLPVLLPLFITDVNVIAHAVGVAVTIVGLLHKGYKYYFHEDVVDPANIQDVK